MGVSEYVPFIVSDKGASYSSPFQSFWRVTGVCSRVVGRSRCSPLSGLIGDDCLEAETRELAICFTKIHTILICLLCLGC